MDKLSERMLKEQAEKGQAGAYKTDALYRALGYAYSDGFAKKLENAGPAVSAPTSSYGPDSFTRLLGRAVGYIYDDTTYSWIKTTLEGK